MHNHRGVISQGFVFLPFIDELSIRYFPTPVNIHKYLDVNECLQACTS